MYLKNIEVHGFKSFAKKINFEFHEGITGIVGPNGSGKSNVADAVRWVFGEQRAKQLRGGNMQDVIFAGTQLRKPMSYASVSITLDNSDKKLNVDYEEVTVARKLYRSGESEYSINGVTCRLKDINELFYDTGIGKEGYSIIGQGQVDQILNGKPEERRELFDEAAGIVKFKRRKNISIKKLNDEQANLERVSDILGELEKQVGPLERQSTVAKEYLEFKQQLRTYDINMFLLEADRLKDLIKETDLKLDILNKELENANLSYEEMKEQYEEAEDEMDFVEATIDRLKKQLNDTNILKQQLEGKIEVLKEQINTVRMSDEHISQRLSSIISDIETRKVIKEKLILEGSELKNKLDLEKEKSDTASNDLYKVQRQITELSTNIEQSKQGIMGLLTDRSSTQAQIQRYDTMKEQGELRRKQLKDNLSSVESEKSELEAGLKKLTVEKINIEDQVRDYTKRIRTIEEEIKVAQAEVADYSNRLRHGETAYHQENSRLQALKNMTERYDGYGNSIRKVMEKKNEMPGLLGVVADLVKTEKAYEIAVETALGGSIQNIVTDTEATAKQMINHLKQNRLGRATFLPLNSIKGGINIRYPEALKEQGVIGVASTLVKIEDKYKSLAESLLGRTVVVESIDVGVALAKKYQHSLRIVTTEGELLNPGGSITGGAFKNTSNLLGRRREVEDLEKKVNILKDELTSIETNINESKKKRSQCYENLEDAKQSSQRLSVLQNTVNMKVEQSQSKLAQIRSTFERVNKENSEIDNQIKSITSNKGSIDTELKSSQAKEKQLASDIEKNQKTLEDLKVQELELLKESEEARISFSSVKQKHEFVDSDILRIQNELGTLEADLEELGDNKGDSTKGIQEKQNEIETILLRIENAKELAVEIQEQVTKEVNVKEELSKKNKDLITKREQMSKQMADLDKESFRLNNQKEGHEEAESKNINYMWEEYQLTYNYAMEQRNPDLTDIQFLKKEIYRIKSDIKKLGPVNVNAIEEYKVVGERYEFMKAQHDDLIEAKETLENIIQELDHAMREQFREQFALIASEYDKVFKQIFGGGQGTLQLQEDEDILEAGVKIIAQPPGKKLQNMMQLSGGEKALTAISLLFAIQNLKPSPFCLLDEIEAALDDANVLRFAQYLHKLTEHTQFIVITHRKGTMTTADRLYGVTMQEKGVSTLISVDLLDDELDK